MMKKYYAITAIIGAIGVILGAFAAHALKQKLAPVALESFQTGVRYQLLHVLFILMVLNIPEKVILCKEKRKITLLTWAGIICFSGSIYLLTLEMVPSKYIWFVTPLGGLMLIVSWLMLAYSSFRK